MYIVRQRKDNSAEIPHQVIKKKNERISQYNVNTQKLVGRQLTARGGGLHGVFVLQVGSKEAKRMKHFGSAEAVLGIYAIEQMDSRLCQLQEAFLLKNTSTNRLLWPGVNCLKSGEQHLRWIPHYKYKLPSFFSHQSDGERKEETTKHKREKIKESSSDG